MIMEGLSRCSDSGLPSDDPEGIRDSDTEMEFEREEEFEEEEDGWRYWDYDD